MVRINNDTFSFIDSAKFFFILGVILIHCDFLQLISPEKIIEPAYTILSTFHEYILSLCVPAFFILSGYLFFKEGFFSLSLYKNKLRRRITSLLIPYLLWNIIGLLCILIKKIPAISPLFPQYMDWSPTLSNILVGMFDFTLTYPFDFVLWFIRNLLIINGVAWIIGLILKYDKTKCLLLVFSLMLLYILQSCSWGIGYSFLYFSAGAWIAWMFGDLVAVTKKLKFYPFVIWIIFIVLSNALPEGPLNELSFAMRTLFGAISLFCLLRTFKHTLPVVLIKTTFFIYAIHGLYVSIIKKAVIALIPLVDNSIYFVDFIVIFFVLLLMSFGIALIIRKISPKLFSVLTGSRG